MTAQGSRARPIVIWKMNRSRERSAAGAQFGVPSGRITDILNGRRSITADTAVRLGHYFGTVAFPGQVGTGWPKETRHLKIAQFWLDLQSQYDIGVVEREKGGEIAKQVRPADAA